MKKNEFNALGQAELEKLLVDTREEISKLRLQKALGQVDNLRLIRNKRKVVARVETRLGELKRAAVK